LKFKQSGFYYFYSQGFIDSYSQSFIDSYSQGFIDSFLILTAQVFKVYYAGIR